MNFADAFGIIGAGHSVPAQIRHNDDPIFAWLNGHQVPGQDLFTGYQERRVLAPGEQIVDHMVQAARRALERANTDPSTVDILLGTASVSEFITPNELALVHQRLGLPTTTWVLPLNDEYTTFISSAVLAHSLLQTRRAQRALIVCGCNWSRYVSYRTPQSISAGDGAGAAVLGPFSGPGQWRLVDAEVQVESDGYGVMAMHGDPIRRQRRGRRRGAVAGYTRPTFHIPAAGQQAYREFGIHAPPRLAARVLERNGLTGADITLITHQSASQLVEAWRAALQPAQYLETLTTFANMTVATIPATLGAHYTAINSDYLLLLGVGVQLHTAALLLRRT